MFGQKCGPCGGIRIVTDTKSCPITPSKTRYLAYRCNWTNTRNLLRDKRHVPLSSTFRYAALCSIEIFSESKHIKCWRSLRESDLPTWKILNTVLKRCHVCIYYSFTCLGGQGTQGTSIALSKDFISPNIVLSHNAYV